MISKKNIEKLDNSAVQLSITVDKAESKKEYNALMTKYSKTVQIKGFRQGKVPTSILEKRFGESLKQEAASNLLEKAFKAAAEDIEEKPLGMATPELIGDLDFNPEEDFSFVDSALCTVIESCTAELSSFSMFFLEITCSFLR